MREFILILAVVMAALAVKSARDEKKKKRLLLQFFREDFGSYAARPLTPERLARAARYHENVHRGEGIDDITWHDLGMDELFCRMDTTLCSYGSEMLYDMLRTPLYDTGLLKERDGYISWLSDNEEARSSLQLAFSDVGRYESMSVSDCVKSLKAQRGSAPLLNLILPDIACFILAIAATVLIFLRPMAGFFVFFTVLFFNLYLYYRRKKKIASTVGCLAVIIRLIRWAVRLKDVDAQDGPLSGYMREMKKRAGSLMPLTRLAFLLTSGRNATGSIYDLILDYFRMFLHLDIMRYYFMADTATEKSDDIMALAASAGELDAFIAVASYRKGAGVWCRPDFEGDGTYQVKGLYHPLVENCVPNDITTEKSVLLTGSNASGKSTFLRSVALSAIMAQTIYTVCAGEYRYRTVKVATSMAISDDLLSGDSYYMAEIKSLKRIMEYALESVPLLCVIDEVLRGTNTAERISAAVEILGRLCEESMCFAATHDLELATLLAGGFDNYHFTEDVDRGSESITFSYRLGKGSARSRNAIKLLSLMGYDEEITRRAALRCDRFIETGKWE